MMMALYTLRILMDLSAPVILKKAIPGMESAALVDRTGEFGTTQLWIAFLS